MTKTARDTIAELYASNPTHRFAESRHGGSVAFWHSERGDWVLLLSRLAMRSGWIHMQNADGNYLRVMGDGVEFDYGWLEVPASGEALTMSIRGA